MLLDPLKQYPHSHAFRLDVVDYINRVRDIFIYTSLRVFTFITWFNFSEDRRTANVIALAPGVECLTVDRE